jgi:hypothetical protein
MQSLQEVKVYKTRGSHIHLSVNYTHKTVLWFSPKFGISCLN